MEDVCVYSVFYKGRVGACGYIGLLVMAKEREKEREMERGKGWGEGGRVRE